MTKLSSTRQNTFINKNNIKISKTEISLIKEQNDNEETKKIYEENNKNNYKKNIETQINKSLKKIVVDETKINDEKLKKYFKDFKKRENERYIQKKEEKDKSKERQKKAKMIREETEKNKKDTLINNIINKNNYYEKRKLYKQILYQDF